MAREVNEPPRGADDRESLFDGNFYLTQYADVKASGMDLLQHYQQYGWHEGRNPNAFLDTSYYLSHNPDVKAAGMNPLQHYQQYVAAQPG